MISLAQAEFEAAAKHWQEQAAHATEQAQKYAALALAMGEVYGEAITRSRMEADELED